MPDKTLLAFAWASLMECIASKVRGLGKAAAAQPTSLPRRRDSAEYS